MKVVLGPTKEMELRKPTLLGDVSFLPMALLVAGIKESGSLCRGWKWDEVVSDVMQPIMTEFVDAFVDDLLAVLPPLRDTQHYIDHDPWTSLLNRPAYWICPKKHEELNSLLRSC